MAGHFGLLSMVTWTNGRTRLITLAGQSCVCFCYKSIMVIQLFKICFGCLGEWLSPCIMCFPIAFLLQVVHVWASFMSNVIFI